MKRTCLLLLLAGTWVTSLHAAPSFTKESGVRISSATPQAVVLSTGGVFRLYFIRDFQVLSATSSDGLNWSEESALRLSTSTQPLLDYSTITACTLLALNDTRLRMIFSAEPSSATFKIYSATSADGLTWSNESAIDLAGSSATFVGSPRLLKLPSGNWRLYY